MTEIDALAEALPWRGADATSPPATRGRSTMRHANVARVPSLGAGCMWFPRQGSAAKSRGDCRRAARLSERICDASNRVTRNSRVTCHLPGLHPRDRRAGADDNVDDIKPPQWRQ